MAGCEQRPRIWGDKRDASTACSADQEEIAASVSPHSKLRMTTHVWC
eukprot:COSAG02_NODE_3385_length_6835_cov_5.668943_1_plen_47_part_00